MNKEGIVAQLTEVKGFKTSDGKLFQDKSQAVYAQALLSIEERYNDDRLLGNQAGSYVEFDQLMEWVRDNIDLLWVMFESCKE